MHASCFKGRGFSFASHHHAHAFRPHWPDRQEVAPEIIRGVVEVHVSALLTLSRASPLSPEAAAVVAANVSGEVGVFERAVDDVMHALRDENFNGVDTAQLRESAKGVAEANASAVRGIRRRCGPRSALLGSARLCVLTRPGVYPRMLTMSPPSS